MTKKYNQKKKYNKKPLPKHQKKQQVQTPVVKQEKPLNKKLMYVILLFLAVFTFIIYSGSMENNFTNWDDNSYVVENPTIHEISKETVKEMFFSEDSTILFHMGNYHPLTMLSLAIDHYFENKYAYFKKAGAKARKESSSETNEFDPYIYHLHNVLLHIANTLLVFLFVFLFFRKSPPNKKLFLASVAALLFGITTIHVESVTWISERKDVLYAFYFFSSLSLYLQYIFTEKKYWLLLSFIAFLLSLLSKGQAVSLAVSLIAIDLYYQRKIFSAKVIAEKIPFFALAFIFGIIAIKAQSVGEAIHDINDYPFYHRILFASYGLTMYFVKLLIPFNHAAVYPYPYGEVPSYFWLFAIPLFAYIIGFYFMLKKEKVVAFTFAFFVINVFLVLQLLPVGSAIMADRYAYVSSLGFSMLLAYGLFFLYNSKKIKYISIGIIVAYVIFLSVKTVTQVKVWKDSVTLWTHTLKISPKAVVGWNNLGSAKDKIAGELKDVNEKIRIKKDAIQDFTRAVELKKDYAHAFYNRGTAKKDIGMETGDVKILESAIYDFDMSLKIKPELAEAMQNRAISKENIGMLDEAIADFTRAISLRPDLAELYSGRGVAKGKQKKLDEAIADFNTALQINPSHSEGYSNRGYALFLKGEVDKSIVDYNRAIEINNENIDAYFNRGLSFLNKFQYELALKDFNYVAQHKPQMSNLYINRGMAYLGLNNNQQACSDFNYAAKLGNTYAAAYIQLYCTGK